MWRLKRITTANLCRVGVDSSKKADHGGSFSLAAFASLKSCSERVARNPRRK
jgi:hypothetical protein